MNDEETMIDQFIKQLGTGLEQAANTLGKLPAEEIQTQLQQVAKDTLTKMDLVTREEFEVQAAMLQKYREKLAQLEARLAELEDTESK
jgi:BMFP domain-containing protein YqiC